jgi:NhaP-type Na+/H+ or K+/H+ antiporter
MMFDLGISSSVLSSVLLQLEFYSSVIVGILLIVAYIFLHKKCQWPLGRFLKYVFFGGVIGFAGTFGAVMALRAINDALWTRNMFDVLIFFLYGSLSFAIGELAGFGLFAWQVARKRRRGIIP